MSYTLEIKGTKITELNDSDLRNLIGLLCETDYRHSELSIIEIIYRGQV